MSQLRGDFFRYLVPRVRTAGPETENARLPIVDILTAGTVRRAPSPLARQVGDTDKSPRYRGAIPFMTL